MMGRGFFVWNCALAGLALVAMPAMAAEDCRLEPVGGGTVAAIVDGRSFTLDGGREVRLAGLQAPSGEDRAAAAKAALDRLISGKNVELKTAQPRTDRYGRILAYAFVSGSETPVQYSLLMQGHAFAAARADSRACQAELLGREKQARDAKAGLWSDPLHAPRRADSPAVTGENGHFTVAEGKVVSVRDSNGVIYVNFGRRWAQSLTVTIRKRAEREFTAAGIEPKRLAGRLVRVRGWIEDRRGPRIEATRPEQIEIAEGN